MSCCSTVKGWEIGSYFFSLGAGETVTVVGDHDPALLKYFDCTRSGPRSAFDSNVVYQFEIMEYVRLFHLFLINQSLAALVSLRIIFSYMLFPPITRKNNGNDLDIYFSTPFQHGASCVLVNLCWLFSMIVYVQKIHLRNALILELLKF